VSHFSDNPASVRVDFFKPGGKWGYTEAVIMDEGYTDTSIHRAFAKALHKHLEGRMKGMIAVCLEPYHEYSFPLMLNVDDIPKHL